MSQDRRSMLDDPQQLRVENVLLRGALFLAGRALKNYHDADHTPGDDPDHLALTVPVSFRERVADAITRAHAMLKGESRGGSR